MRFRICDLLLLQVASSETARYLMGIHSAYPVTRKTNQISDPFSPELAAPKRRKKT